MVEISYFALFLLLASCIAAGVVAAVVHTWSLRALLYSIDTRLVVVEGLLQREVKARAGQERWKKPAKDEELVKELLKQTVQPPAYKGPWWTNPNLRRGGVPSGTVQEDH